MGTSMTAMLVGPEGVRHPHGVTTTIPRDEIEEALASDAPLDLYLDVARERGGSVETMDVKVSWQREDLERLLDRFESDDITLSFDEEELARWLDDDFEAHGIREMVMLTVAAASASAALAVSTASAQPMEAPGGGTAAVVVTPAHGEAGAPAYLAPAIHDEAGAAQRGVDQTVPANDEAGAATRGIDVGIATAIGANEASTARDLATPAIHDEAGAVQRAVGQTIPGNDEAGATARGVDPAIATAMEATTARDLATPAIHDEATLAARGVDRTVPGMDEATLTARGIVTPTVHDEAGATARGIETPVVVDSGTGFELPSIDDGTAAAIGGLAGAGMLIAAAAFAVRRQRPGAA
jgi:hypothetical protein